MINRINSQLKESENETVSRLFVYVYLIPNMQHLDANYMYFERVVVGQRPLIIVPIDSHCNLPQNKTHS